jgi:hypothetical protein
VLVRRSLGVVRAAAVGMGIRRTASRPWASSTSSRSPRGGAVQAESSCPSVGCVKAPGFFFNPWNTDCDFLVSKFAFTLATCAATPWGGGNQFLMALVKEFRRRKIKVVENAMTDKVQLYMANAVTFKVDAFREAMRKAPAGKKLKLVHRLDGPYYAARYNKDPRKEASKPYRAREDTRVYEVGLYKLNAPGFNP